MNLRLKNQSFFMSFNKLVFPWLYMRYWGKQTAIVRCGKDSRFKVRVNTSDILLIWEIWRFKIYRDLRFPIRPGDTVVDIGAHIGVFAIWAAQQAHAGRVFAYEASSTNHQLLLENKRLNGAGNLHVENLGVFDRPGEFAFYQPGKNGALGSMLQDEGAHKEIVQATTLAEIFSTHGLETVHYLKMDVEGAEYAILLNSPASCLDRVRYLVLEYHRFDGLAFGPQDLKDRLESHGFTVEVAPGILWQEKLFGTGVIRAWRQPQNTPEKN